MRVFRQQDGFSCGPRALQIAFSHYNVYPKYSELFHICGTDGNGTPIENFNTVVEHYGFCCDEYEEEASVELIKKYTDIGVPVIVLWYAGQADHVSVAYEVDSKFIYLLDPSTHLYTEPTIRIRRTMLNKCWKHHPDSRWIMAIMERKE